MITPRRTRLLRVPGLRALQNAIAAIACPPDVARTRACAVIVSTTAAASELRLTLENLLLLPGAGGTSGARQMLVLPDLVTRGGWYARLHEHLSAAPPLLSPLEREVLAHAAAREAIARGFEPPFKLRAGLVSELLAFYDDLRRNRRTVDAFERLMTDELEPRASIDRGAERLLRQTRFLAVSFRAYERRREASGGLDEHTLRDLLLCSNAPAAHRQIVVTVGDRASDDTGLCAADFDLLTRLAGLEALDVIATGVSLGAGLDERLRELLPGIEEVRWSGNEPEAEPPHRVFFTSRDREEELADVARRLKAAHRGSDGRARLDRTAVVFRRPLPYVYLGQAVLDAAGVPFQAVDALPLAAEPFAAAVDLVFSCVTSGFRRAAVTALLACPHFEFELDGEPVGPEAVLALDHALTDAGFLGGTEELSSFASSLDGPPALAARASSRATEELVPLASAAPMSAHLSTLLAFLRRHERRFPPDEGVWERHQRARAAILVALESLRAAHLHHDDPAGSFADLAATVRRWIEEQTFSPRRGGTGVHLVDAHTAKLGDYDDVFLVGLVDIDWPGGSSTNIFYPAALLSQLGWPAGRARRAAMRAAFVDLLGLARNHVTISAFTLEDDALVARSSLLEEVEEPAVPPAPDERVSPVKIFRDEGLVADPVRADALPPRAQQWLALRQMRSPASDARFHGQTGPLELASYSVTAVDVYIECPFKFFATYVLRLDEEPEDEEGVTPRERGKFVHEVLRTFYAEWLTRGGTEITPDNLGDARRLFNEMAERALERLPAADAAAERAGLLGSPVMAGAGEIVLAAEAAKPWPVRERLLEHGFDGTFELTGELGARRLRLRGTIDRIDVLADGRVRIVDYKTGRAFDWRRSTQLPVYAVCATQLFQQTRGETLGVAEAVYLVLAGTDNVKVAIPEGKGGGDAITAGQQRFLEAVGGIERGEFPPRPADTHLCTYCRFATVCRKEYVGGE